jgi:hypothetical protein
LHSILRYKLRIFFDIQTSYLKFVSFLGGKNDTVCDGNKIKCIKKIEEEFFRNVLNCGCLEKCETVKYQISVQRGLER